ncbi:hypothetical protein D3C80_962660 [compost metagenome]
MEIYTIQMGQWRRARDAGIELIDTTWRNGNQAFSPNKDIVHGYKYSGLTQEQYTERYLEILEGKVLTHTEEWERVITLDRVAVACMCRAGVFCHRHLLWPKIVSYGAWRGTEIVYKGEL